MLKKTLIAAFIIGSAVFAAQPASAGTNLNFGFGIGGPNYGGGHYGGGYYDGGHYGGYHRVSCREARRIIRHRGFRQVRALDCSGSRYRFKARRGYKRFIIRMKSNSGRIYSIRRI